MTDFGLVSLRANKMMTSQTVTELFCSSETHHVLGIVLT